MPSVIICLNLAERTNLFNAHFNGPVVPYGGLQIHKTSGVSAIPGESQIAQVRHILNSG